jgi:exopolyphosphatase/guanosine-5'-triphosphate,3'-diphosphate pyrophosphatase
VYRALGWQEALGSSGTNKAIGDICAAMKLTKGAVTAPALPQVRDRLLQAETIDKIDLPGLPAERKAIIAGGLLVLEAAFDVLKLERMAVSKAALREGVLYDMLGRGGADDPRDASVAALMQRYGIDPGQAQRVEDTAMQLFDQVCDAWGLTVDARAMLSRAAKLHELGLAIAPSQYHVHGAYVLENSDIAGFSQQEQRLLAALVRTHRRGIPKTAFDAIPDRLLVRTKRIAALLRIAVLLHRSHEADSAPVVDAKANGENLVVMLDKRWLDQRPLVRQDMSGEPEDAADLGVTLRIDAA